MTTMERRYFAGDTLAQAVMAAARHFGLEPGEVEYRLVEKRHGFVKTRRKVLVEVDPAGPRRAPAATVRPSVAAPAAPLPAALAPGAAEAAVTDSPPAAPRHPLAPIPAPAGEGSPATPAARVAAVAEAVRRICAVADLRLEPEIAVGADALVVSLRGEDEEVLAEDDGEVVSALEYLLPRAARGLAGELVAVRVGGAGTRELAEEELRALALQAAVEVREQRRPKVLARMTPAERRVVHVTLAEEPGVETESRGDGFYKQVVVRPA